MNVENLDQLLFEHCFVLFCTTTTFCITILFPPPLPLLLFFFFFLNRNHLHEIFLISPLSSISLPNPVIKKNKNTYQQGDCNKNVHFQSIYQTINPITTKKLFEDEKKNSFKNCRLCCCSSCFVFLLPEPPLPKKGKNFGVLKTLWFSFICNYLFFTLFGTKRKKDENN